MQDAVLARRLLIVDYDTGQDNPFFFVFNLAFLLFGAVFFPSKSRNILS